MDTIKVIFFDIDGTLIDMKKKKVSSNMLKTLVALKNKGIKICIATGRSPMQVPIFEDVIFDTIMTYNGSYCYSDEGVIFNNPIKKPTIYKLIENTEKINRPVSVATNSQLAANGFDADLKEYYSFGGAEYIINPNFEDIIKNNDIYQLMLGCKKGDYDKILNGVTDAKITAWWDKAVDIIPSDGGKGKAVTEILKHYGFKKENALAFGDGKNDIALLESVGHGVAMGNASIDLIQISDDICKTVSDDGIYHYCLEHGLIETQK